MRIVQVSLSLLLVNNVGISVSASEFKTVGVRSIKHGNDLFNTCSYIHTFRTTSAWPNATVGRRASRMQTVVMDWDLAMSIC